MLSGERCLALRELLRQFVAPHPKSFQLALDARQRRGQRGVRGAPRLHLHRQLTRLLLRARGRRARLAQPVAHAVALLLERHPPVWAWRAPLLRGPPPRTPGEARNSVSVRSISRTTSPNSVSS